ncbi:MAG: hypothetical protein E4H10_02655 [Bacteroidia bacterium]|nr:MAG: hypothetical protein E4H10_02655 [Bacteroidia bacterium]
MKRDPHISKLIRESGLTQAPDSFTAVVMDKIEAIPLSKPFKPLIGRGGRIMIILFLSAVVVISVIYTDPGGELFGSTLKLPTLDRQLPQLNLNLEFLKQVNISTGVVAALVAMFILVLSDAGLNRRRKLT